MILLFLRISQGRLSSGNKPLSWALIIDYYWTNAARVLLISVGLGKVEVRSGKVGQFPHPSLTCHSFPIHNSYN